MEEIQKALQDLAVAVERNDTLANVKVTITIKKPKADKASDESR